MPSLGNQRADSFSPGYVARAGGGASGSNPCSLLTRGMQQSCPYHYESKGLSDVCVSLFILDQGASQV